MPEFGEDIPEPSVTDYSTNVNHDQYSSMDRTNEPGSTSSSGTNLESVPGDQVGNYRLLEIIGEGGMGAVWLAEQQHPVRRRVALKLIKAGMDSKEVLARFEAERQALAMMDHQSIAKVLDAGFTEKGRPFFAMELVNGARLTQFCDDSKLPIEDRIRLFISVCNAIQHAHQKGIIHRDLKPSNILVTHYEGKPLPKVIDFGLAKALQHEIQLTDKSLYTELGQIIGTFQYMSPEQATRDSNDIDTRSDIYSLGVILYELLTGSTPIDKNTVRRNAVDVVIETIRRNDPVPPSSRLTSMNAKLDSISDMRRAEPARLRRSLKGDLDWIVMKALEKDRTRRYESASEFAADLVRFLNGEPVSARPPSTRYRLQKFVQRHRGWVASAMVFAFLMISATATSLGFAISADKAKKEALRLKEVANVNAERAVDAEKEARHSADRARAAQRQAILDRNAALEAENRVRWRLYAYQIRTAQFEWRAGDAAVARKAILDSPIELRGWEHRYLYTLFNSNVVDLEGTESLTLCCDASEDGKWLATGGYDGYLRIWDATTRALLHVVKAHDGNVKGVQFSPDSEAIISAGSDGVIHIWNCETGQRRESLQEHDFPIVDIRIAIQGNRMVSADTSGKILVWDTNPFSIVNRYQNATPGTTSVTIDRMGNRVASCTVDGLIRIWEVGESTEPLIYSTDNRRVTATSFSNDGTRLIAIGNTDGIFVLNAHDATLDKILDIKGIKSCVAISPDDRVIAVGGFNKVVVLIDAETGQQLENLKGHTSVISAAKFTPDGDSILTGGFDETAKLWRLRSARQDTLLSGHSLNTSEIAFCPTRPQFASGGLGGDLIIWNLETRAAVLHQHYHDGGINDLDYSPDGTFLVTSGIDKTVKVVDAISGDQLQVLETPGNTPYACAILDDNRTIVAGYDDGEVRLWDRVSGEVVASLSGHTTRVQALAKSPDGSRLAVSDSEGTIRIWALDSFEPIYQWTAASGRVLDLDYSSDGKRIASVGIDRITRVFDIESQEPVAEFGGHANPLTSVSFSPDGTQVFSTAGNSIKVWNIENREEALTFSSEMDAISKFRLSPDGRFGMAGGVEGRIQVYDAREVAPLPDSSSDEVQ